MVPAPKKPIPLITCAPSRAGSMLVRPLYSSKIKLEVSITRGRTHRYEYMCSKAGRSVWLLTLKPNDTAKNACKCEPQQCLKRKTEAITLNCWFYKFPKKHQLSPFSALLFIFSFLVKQDHITKSRNTQIAPKHEYTLEATNFKGHIMFFLYII